MPHAARPVEVGTISAFVLAVFFAACAGNPYLARYKVQTLDEERALLARYDAELAGSVYNSRTEMQKSGGTPERIVALTSAYHGLAEKVGKGNEEVYDYCCEAAFYEFKVYKSRGGSFPPTVLAELGRNLFLRDEGGAKKYLERALAQDPALQPAYGKYLEELKKQ